MNEPFIRVGWLSTWLSWYLVMLPAFYAEKAILKDGPAVDTWFKIETTRQILIGRGETWQEKNDGLYTCGTGDKPDFWVTTNRIELNTSAEKIYIDVEVNLTICDGGMKCFSNSFEMHMHRHKNVTDQLAIPGQDKITEYFYETHFSSLYNISNQTSPNSDIFSVQTFSFRRNNSSAVTFAARSRGACGTIFRMKMYYYVCEETILKGIKLKKTFSPAEGFRNVTANCSENSVPVTDRVRIFNGYCYANGTWALPEDQNFMCSCIKGYGVNKTDGSCSNSNHSITSTGKPETTTKHSTTSTNDDDDDKSMIYIIIGVVAGVLLILIPLLVIGIRKRRNRNKLKKTPNNGHEYVNEGVELPSVGRRMYVEHNNYGDPETALKEFASELSPDMILLERMIGEGEFGDVYKGELTAKDGQKIPVAVKTLKHDADAKAGREFILKASVMGQFKNPNIVRMIGVVTKSIPRMIVLEFMSNGSLDNYLKNNLDALTSTKLLGLAKGVSAGMSYLAEMNFIHKDLAARNVLLNDDVICKIADFGHSRNLLDNSTSGGEIDTRGGKGPIRWTAPEVIRYRKYSSASDVWSFGILLWEIMSFGKRPYGKWCNSKVIEKVNEGYRLPPPKNCPKAVHGLMLKCWEAEKSKRPKFALITTVINDWIKSPETMNNEVDLSSSIGEWLLSIKMSNYEEAFIKAGYRHKSDVTHFTDEDLITVGIFFISDRNKIMKAINALRNKRN